MPASSAASSTSRSSLVEPASPSDWPAVEAALSAPAPRLAVERLRADGLLASAMSELEALFGVPQPPRSHPEIDAGLHSLMTLEQAGLLTADPVVRFGALVHDIGKGVTPRSEWPRHKGHEERGVPLVDQLCRRLGAPEAYRLFGMFAARGHGLAHKAAELRPGTLLDLLESCGPLDDPAGIERLVVVGWADKRGRTGFGDVGYPPAAALREARAAVAAEPEHPESSLLHRRLRALAQLRGVPAEAVSQEG